MAYLSLVGVEREWKKEGGNRSFEPAPWLRTGKSLWCRENVQPVADARGCQKSPQTIAPRSFLYASRQPSPQIHLRLIVIVRIPVCQAEDPEQPRPQVRAWWIHQTERSGIDGQLGGAKHELAAMDGHFRLEAR